MIVSRMPRAALIRAFTIDTIGRLKALFLTSHIRYGSLGGRRSGRIPSVGGVAANYERGPSCGDLAAERRFERAQFASRQDLRRGRLPATTGSPASSGEAPSLDLSRRAVELHLFDGVAPKVGDRQMHKVLMIASPQESSRTDTWTSLIRHHVRPPPTSLSPRSHEIGAS